MTSSGLVVRPALAALLTMVLAHEAAAATLWRGTAIVTNRTNNAACVAEYDIGESYDVEYRPNLGAPVDEVMMVFGPHGAYVIASGAADADKTLRTGSVTIQGAAYAARYSVTNPTQTLSISPAAITTTTVTITVTGTVRNLGVPNCHVTVRASLLPIASPF